jgi:hypothetical protein
MRRQHGINGVGRHCVDNDAQPDTSAAAKSTANTTMHNSTAFHTAGSDRDVRFARTIVNAHYES